MYYMCAFALTLFRHILTQTHLLGFLVLALSFFDLLIFFFLVFFDLLSCLVLVFFFVALSPNTRTHSHSETGIGELLS